MSAAEGEADTQAHVCRALCGNVLLGELAHDAVHTGEETEALGVDVDYPSEAGSQRTETEVDAAFQPLHGMYVGREL